MESFKVCKGIANVILAEGSLEFLESRHKSLSEGIHQVVQRYEEILRRTELPTFTTSEIDLLMFLTEDAPCQSATQTGRLLQEIKTCLTDDLTGEVTEADAALIAKIAGLTYTQEFALLDRLEQRRI